MKKEEAQKIAVIKAEEIIEYITETLSIDKKTVTYMTLSDEKINNERMCTLDIYKPEINFRAQANLGITKDHCIILYRQLFIEFITKFLNSDTIAITRFRSIKSEMDNYSGVDVMNGSNNIIKINFNTTHPDFMNITSEYNRCHTEYTESLKNTPKSK